MFKNVLVFAFSAELIISHKILFKWINIILDLFARRMYNIN